MRGILIDSWIMLPIFITGVRNGEKITSTPGSKQNAGSNIIVYSNDGSDIAYPPSRRALVELSEAEWDKTFEFLSSLSYFENKTSSEMRKWLIDNATDNEDLYLDDLDLLISPVVLTGSLFDSSLSDELNAKYIAPNPNNDDGLWNLKVLYKAIKHKNPNSRARHHTLVFRPNIWTVVSEKEEDVRSYKGVVFDINSGKFIVDQREVYHAPSDRKIHILTNLPRIKGKGFAVSYLTDPVLEKKIPPVDVLLDLIISVTGSTNNEIQRCRELISWASPAFHKSLIQKIIRTGAENITFEEEILPARVMLLVSFVLLLVHPGSLVPDLQIFVTGAESAMKRVAVSICEDSYLEDSGRTLLSLYLGAYLYRRWRWVPNLDIIRNWMEVMIKATSSIKIYDYDTKTYAALVHDEKVLVNGYYLSAIMLEQLKSFPSDINLVSWIAYNNGRARNSSHVKRLISSIPIYHAVDHHVYTDFAYFCPSVVFEVYSLAPSDDFSEFFSLVWEQCSGINVRKDNYTKFIGKDGLINANDFLTGIRRAQRLLFLSKSGIGIDNLMRQRIIVLNDKNRVEIAANLDDSWISGLIGPIELKYQRKIYLVSVDPHDILLRKVMFKPVRNIPDNATVTEDVRDILIREFDNTISSESGVKVIAPTSIPWLRNTHIRLVNSVYQVKMDKKWINWNKVKNAIIEVPTFTLGRADPPSLELSIYISWLVPKGTKGTKGTISDMGDGMETEAFDKIGKIILESELPTLARMLTLIRGNSARITMPEISKSGHSAESVRISDVKIYDLFSQISCLVPFGIRRKSSDTRHFTVTYTPLLIIIRQMIEERLHENVVYPQWPEIRDVSGRITLEHQQSTVDAILGDEKRAHIIDIPVGLGKTKIVCEVIRWLSLPNRLQLPPYIVYTLPPSAKESVMSEFSHYGLKVNLLDPRKNTKSKNITLEKFVVNLIFHDHLKHEAIIGALKLIMPDTILIVDEFHLTLNATKRTASALELSRTSHKFIAMSGTPMKDSQIELLIPWLEQIVDFEVTPRNIWTAVAGMISRRIKLDINVVRENIEATMNKETEKSYLSLFTGTVDSRMSSDNFLEALKICYRVCKDRIVKIALEQIQNGENVMIVSKNIADQNEFRQRLIDNGIDSSMIALITTEKSINLLPGDKSPLRIAITTMRHSTGYNLTKMGILITTVYFSDQATREQLEGRIVRLSQNRSSVSIFTVHSGILTTILQRYELSRSMSAAQKSMADEIGISLSDFKKTTDL